MSKGLDKLAAIVDRAMHHAATCRDCLAPIVKDKEGNPGYRSEACTRGAEILQEWADAETEFYGSTVS